MNHHRRHGDVKIWVLRWLQRRIWRADQKVSHMLFRLEEPAIRAAYARRWNLVER